jgi:hypothetical protein
MYLENRNHATKHIQTDDDDDDDDDDMVIAIDSTEE